MLCWAQCFVCPHESSVIFPLKLCSPALSTGQMFVGVLKINLCVKALYRHCRCKHRSNGKGLMDPAALLALH